MGVVISELTGRTLSGVSKPTPCGCSITSVALPSASVMPWYVIDAWEEPKGVPPITSVPSLGSVKPVVALSRFLPCDMVTVKLALGTLNPFSALTEWTFIVICSPTLATALRNDSSPLK
ncbi:Uncharacterised protein [Salmonella enterica subsp. enterica serovar Bovismorbificans]|nr:Uncharacterised protein [Salmonella enterica subsp. enterica serovar Bovismorbificans]CNU31183.1 Uncharacterised protein [Salmonella enterica subsp. enterica serovar Bovismorbificans]CNU65436.1 Uncharacterised protein [Salmonella enterica subsp. enterica serovar Bovismorbificans]CNU98455.1 Uncharacterised protein [Salmonella enterica subsp. enterica serovar Bovismorbificans]CNV06224.1 Uncharacterised protein [Salmonella enterica subsp. enterica serovar Bovismorbificans]